MSLVIRRKTLDCHSRRYFAKPNPAAHLIDHARRFDTSAEAETERGDLREPWLWETLDEADAARAHREKMLREAKQEAGLDIASCRVRILTGKDADYYADK